MHSRMKSLAPLLCFIGKLDWDNIDKRAEKALFRHCLLGISCAEQSWFVSESRSACCQHGVPRPKMQAHQTRTTVEVQFTCVPTKPVAATTSSRPSETALMDGRGAARPRRCDSGRHGKPKPLTRSFLTSGKSRPRYSILIAAKRPNTQSIVVACAEILESILPAPISGLLGHVPSQAPEGLALRLGIVFLWRKK